LVNAFVSDSASAGKKLLVPLTASLYVPGTLDDAEKVLVDVGTGYFIEVPCYLQSPDT
jgi:prefoldin alpha subunit